MTIRIREFEDTHLPSIGRLLNQEYGDSFEFIPFSDERILSQIRRRDLRILVAEENSNVLGLIATRLEERGEVNINWLSAQEGPERRIIENMLLQRVEENVKGDTLSASADEESSEINDWISRGYVLNPGWLKMSAKLDGLKPVPKVSEGTVLRSLRPEEEEDFVEVVNTGFGWQRLKPGDIKAWKSEDQPFSEDWVQVAEINERIVSVVVAKPDTDFNKYTHLNRGYLGPATTLQEYRSKHLASALTARAMNFLYEKGLNSVRLGTSELNLSSIALLRSLGFQVDNVRKILRKKLKNA